MMGEDQERRERETESRARRRGSATMRFSGASVRSKPATVINGIAMWFYVVFFLFLFQSAVTVWFSGNGLLGTAANCYQAPRGPTAQHICTHDRNRQCQHRDRQPPQTTATMEFLIDAICDRQAKINQSLAKWTMEQNWWTPLRLQNMYRRNGQLICSANDLDVVGGTFCAAAFNRLMNGNYCIRLINYQSNKQLINLWVLLRGIGNLCEKPMVEIPCEGRSRILRSSFFSTSYPPQLHSAMKVQ